MMSSSSRFLTFLALTALSNTACDARVGRTQMTSRLAASPSGDEHDPQALGKDVWGDAIKHSNDLHAAVTSIKDQTGTLHKLVQEISHDTTEVMTKKTDLTTAKHELDGTVAKQQADLSAVDAALVHAAKTSATAMNQAKAAHGKVNEEIRAAVESITHDPESVANEDHGEHGGEHRRENGQGHVEEQAPANEDGADVEDVDGRDDVEDRDAVDDIDEPNVQANAPVNAKASVEANGEANGGVLANGKPGGDLREGHQEAFVEVAVQTGGKLMRSERAAAEVVVQKVAASAVTSNNPAEELLAKNLESTKQLGVATQQLSEQSGKLTTTFGTLADQTATLHANADTLLKSKDLLDQHVTREVDLVGDIQKTLAQAHTSVDGAVTSTVASQKTINGNMKATATQATKPLGAGKSLDAEHETVDEEVSLVQRKVAVASVVEIADNANVKTDKQAGQPEHGDYWKDTTGHAGKLQESTSRLHEQTEQLSKKLAEIQEQTVEVLSIQKEVVEKKKKLDADVEDEAALLVSMKAELTSATDVSQKAADSQRQEHKDLDSGMRASINTATSSVADAADHQRASLLEVTGAGKVVEASVA